MNEETLSLVADGKQVIRVSVGEHIEDLAHSGECAVAGLLVLNDAVTSALMLRSTAESDFLLE